MSLYFSGSTGGFYDDAINDSIPPDAVEITPAQHQALLAGQGSGQIIVSQKDGTPALAAAPAPTDAALAASMRSTRNALLVLADSAVATIEDAGGNPASWRAWRVALRSVPEQSGFPKSIAWPLTPTDVSLPAAQSAAIAGLLP